MAKPARGGDLDPRSAKGELITGEMLEALSAEAEAGYDPATLRLRKTKLAPWERPQGITEKEIQGLEDHKPVHRWWLGRCEVLQVKGRPFLDSKDGRWKVTLASGRESVTISVQKGQFHLPEKCPLGP